MVFYSIVILALCFVVHAGSIHLKGMREFSDHLKVEDHGFPEVNEHGFQLANEFQLLHPENIVTYESLGATQNTYIIKNVSPLVISNDGIINVSYYSSQPSWNDWIGAYSPGNVSDFHSTVPVKYGWCSIDHYYKSTGHGWILFNMTNLRDDIGFYFFSNGTTYPILMNSSSLRVTFDNVNQPLRPRVVATGNPDVLKLLWSSASSAAPVLRWGTSPGSYSREVEANSSFIPQSAMCGPPASTVGWRDMGLIHSAYLSGMVSLSGSKIYYSFGDASSNDFSEEFFFVVPPAAGLQPPARPTTVILFDDLGRGSTDHTYTWNEYGRPSVYTMMSVGARVFAGQIDAIYHGGDISYATGYEAVWDFFLDMISPIAARTLYLTTVGNHESDWPGTASYYTGTDSGGECGVTATTMLPMPAPAVTNSPWWSYDVGLIHFIGMSTEHNYTVGSPQHRWLEQDLAGVNRTITPWIIFGGHRAMYINSDYGGTTTSDIAVMNLLIENIEPLLWKYRVNVGFYGHNHAVQRQTAVLNKTVVQRSSAVHQSDGSVIHWHSDPQATVHMVVGTGGASFTVNAMDPPPIWSELTFYKFGYALVTAVNASYLDWQWIQSSTDEVFDHMVITQKDPSQPWVIPPTPPASHSEGLSTESISLIVASVIVFSAICGVGLYYFKKGSHQTDYCAVRMSTDVSKHGIEAGVGRPTDLVPTASNPMNK